MTGDEVFASLADKLRSLDLDAGEAAVLAVILRRVRDADGPEVEGFGFEVGSLGFKGTDEELQAFRSGGRGFKGTDEELQALIDWSGKPR